MTQDEAERLAQAHSMLSDLLNGWPASQLCTDPQEWLVRTADALAREGYPIDS